VMLQYTDERDGLWSTSKENTRLGTSRRQRLCHARHSLTWEPVYVTSRAQL
jgi:hypothetical protein